MEKLLLILLLVLTLGSCNIDTVKVEPEKPKEVEESFSVKSLKPKKELTLGSKNTTRGEFLITTLSKISVDGKVKLEIHSDDYNTYFREHQSERGERAISLRIKLSASNKWKSSGSDFLPEFKIYKKLDEKDSLTPKSFQYIKDLSINFYKKPEDNFFVLEQYFNYKETGTFVIWADLPDSDFQSSLYIVASLAKNSDFEKEHILGILAAKQVSKQNKVQLSKTRHLE